MIFSFFGTLITSTVTDRSYVCTQLLKSCGDLHIRAFYSYRPTAIWLHSDFSLQITRIPEHEPFPKNY